MIIRDFQEMVYQTTFKTIWIENKQTEHNKMTDSFRIFWTWHYQEYVPIIQNLEMPR